MTDMALTDLPLTYLRLGAEGKRVHRLMPFFCRTENARASVLAPQGAVEGRQARTCDFFLQYSLSVGILCPESDLSKSTIDIELFTAA